MSIERAYMNCNDCYEIAEKYIQNGEDLSEEEVIVLNGMRNHAMISLEQTTNQGKYKDDMIKNMLSVCAECNFKKPNIARLAKNSGLFKSGEKNPKD